MISFSCCKQGMWVSIIAPVQNWQAMYVDTHTALVGVDPQAP